jgi:hypothetical protein
MVTFAAATANSAVEHLLLGLKLNAPYCLNGLKKGERKLRLLIIETLRD